MLAIVSISCFFTVFATVNFSVSLLIMHKYIKLIYYSHIFMPCIHCICIGSADSSSSDSTIYSHCRLSYTGHGVALLTYGMLLLLSLLLYIYIK